MYCSLLSLASKAKAVQAIGKGGAAGEGCKIELLERVANRCWIKFIIKGMIRSY
ncbi:conserved hypothetical protein [Ricinus communis]|uniref:Uncharacterized protein n=1 Tax=Ricinus communis TaxID=3988 RepID=B9S5I5_RICCO|nr:conserved hypothetical protein [Ricinus communis]